MSLLINTYNKKVSSKCTMEPFFPDFSPVTKDPAQMSSLTWTVHLKERTVKNRLEHTLWTMNVIAFRSISSSHLKNYRQIYVRWMQTVERGGRRTYFVNRTSLWALFLTFEGHKLRTIDDYIYSIYIYLISFLLIELESRKRRERKRDDTYYVLLRFNGFLRTIERL